MTRPTAVALLTAAVALVAPPASADPPKFRPFNGVSPEQFLKSSVGRWADQLVTDLGAARGELAAARPAPPDRDAIAARVNNTAAAAAALGKLARTTHDRGQLLRAFAPVEAEYGGLNDLVSRNPHAAQAFARVGYDYGQLAAALTEGDADGTRAKASVLRLARALDEQADDLRDAADREPAAVPRELDRAIRGFTRAARKLHRDLDATGDVAAAADAFPAVGQAWGVVVALLDRAADLPAPVRAQAARVDGLYRKLGGRFAAVLPPEPNAPAPAPPPPVARQAPRRAAVVAIAAGAGGGPRVQVFHDLRAAPALDFFAYEPEFRGGVRVSVADLDGDGVPDVVTAPGTGMPPLVRVYSGQDGGLLTEFYGADPQWQGGVQVAATATADGRALVAVAPDAGGGPQVRVFDLGTGKEAANFFAYPREFRGGVRLAWADVNGDGVPDVVAAPGPGEAAAVVRVFNLADQKVLAEFAGFDPRWRGGVWVAADQTGRVACGTDAGGGPFVRVFRLPQLRKPAGEWLGFPEPYRGGVRVAVADVDADGVPDVVVAPGAGLRDCPVRVLSGKDGRELAVLAAFPGFEGGAFVAAR